MKKTDVCIICGGAPRFFFLKKYTAPFNKLLDEATFYKCPHCGFTYSKTLFEMSDARWERLNSDFHSYIENMDNTRVLNQPPYMQQALMLSMLGKNQLINIDNMIDYAGGVGTLSKILSKYFNIALPVYEQYVTKGQDGSVCFIKEQDLARADVLFNSAFFEHIRCREDLEKVNRYVSKQGVLIVHTVVCENIPNDPNWFYVSPPVHSALHTNKSMALLMEQMGYQSSLYCPLAKCWVLYRKEPKGLEEHVRLINQEQQATHLVYSKGFMSYWKGF